MRTSSAGFSALPFASPVCRSRGGPEELPPPATLFLLRGTEVPVAPVDTDHALTHLYPLADHDGHSPISTDRRCAVALAITGRTDPLGGTLGGHCQGGDETQHSEGTPYRFPHGP